MPKKKAKAKPIWKIYLAWTKKDNEFYIGMTSKEGKALDNYFGSSKRSSGWEDRDKEILFKTERKSEAKYLEALLTDGSPRRREVCQRHAQPSH